MKLGIVGLPNVGKSTLFNAITNAGAQSANYPFCTIEPNMGVVDVPDSRIEKLSVMNSSKKEVPASIVFYDIAGLVKGASKGEGLGNKFLSHIREVDAIVHVVRCFVDENVVHVDGEIGAKKDVEVINLELILSDLEVIEKIISKVKKNAKGDKSLLKELELLERLHETLFNEKPIRSLDLNDDEKKAIKGYNLLTAKPTIYVANIDLDSDNPFYDELDEIAKSEGSEIIEVSAQIEQELSELSAPEKKEFLEELGLEESGLEKLIKASYKLLDLISFFTSGEMETKAWTIKKGTLAPFAAGKIHTDIQKGFIKAEVINYDELINFKSLNEAKDSGKLRLEGKEYIMKDGDVVHFRFNV